MRTRHARQIRTCLAVEKLGELLALASSESFSYSKLSSRIHQRREFKRLWLVSDTFSKCRMNEELAFNTSTLSEKDRRHLTEWTWNWIIGELKKSMDVMTRQLREIEKKDWST